jgi:hypothetical protein
MVENEMLQGVAPVPVVPGEGRPEAADQDSWLPGVDPSLKPERVQELLMQAGVRQEVSALLSRLAQCDRQRIRLSVTAKKAVFTVEAVPRSGMAGKLMQTALKLGHAA